MAPRVKRKNTKAYAKFTTKQARARYLVAQAIRAGKLVREACEICLAPRTHAHHDDYSKPLNVRWLCPAHHAEHHASSNIKRCSKCKVDKSKEDFYSQQMSCLTWRLRPECKACTLKLRHLKKMLKTLDMGLGPNEY